MEPAWAPSQLMVRMTMPWPAELANRPPTPRHLRALVSCEAVADELPLVVDGARRPSAGDGRAPADMPRLPSRGGRLPAPPASAAKHAGEPGPPAFARTGRQYTEHASPAPPLGTEAFSNAVANRGCIGPRGCGCGECRGTFGAFGPALAVERRNLTWAAVVGHARHAGGKRPPTACERGGAILVRSGFERGPRRPEGYGSLGQ